MKGDIKLQKLESFSRQ